MSGEPETASSDLALWDLKGTIVDHLLKNGWLLAVNGATDGVASSEHLLNSAPELTGDGAFSHLSGDIVHSLEGQVAVVLDVLHLFAVTDRLLKLLDQEGGG